MRRRTNKTKFYQTRRSTHTLRDKLAGRGARAGGNGQKDDRLFGQPLCCRHPWSLASGSPKIRIVDKGTRVRPIYKRSTPPSRSTNSVLIGARDSGIPLESLTSKYLIAWIAIRRSFHVRSFFFFLHSIFFYQFQLLRPNIYRAIPQVTVLLHRRNNIGARASVDGKLIA